MDVVGTNHVDYKYSRSFMDCPDYVNSEQSYQGKSILLDYMYKELYEYVMHFR